MSHQQRDPTPAELIAFVPKRIQRKRSKGWRMPEGAIYVGRPTRWGNPFIVSSEPARLEHYADYTKNVDLWHGWPCVDAATAVRAFREMKAAYIPRIVLDALRGKDLACWCPLDKPCHADVLLELANTALLTVLEGRRQEDHDDDSTRSGRPDDPSAFSIHAPTDTKG